MIVYKFVFLQNKKPALSGPVILYRVDVNINQIEYIIKL